MALQPIDPSLLFSRNDPEDPRLGELVRESNLTADVDLFGWPDDDGIAMNGGRIGASQGPDRIRRFLYRMTPPQKPGRLRTLADMGNLAPGSSSLADRHHLARGLVRRTYEGGRRALSFGGGHDYGFPDAAAFLDVNTQAGGRPLVVNFDAHLDVRSTQSGFHSGTPFRRLLEEFHGRFDFLEIGLQEHCNSSAHATWAQTQGATLWWLDGADNEHSWTDRLETYLTHRQGTPCFVSFDIDALSSVSAPGCSQSWDTGLSRTTAFALLDLIARMTDWKGLGIYEVSPPLDVDDRTSKLAAQIAYRFLAPKGR